MNAPLSAGRLSLLSAAASALLLLPYLLMPVLRSAVRARAPERAARWERAGSFAVVGTGYPLNLDEAGYATRVRSAARHFWPYDGFILENRTARMASNEALVYAPMGLLLRLTGSLDLVWLITRALCCALWFFVLYRVVEEATGAPALALFAACALTFFSYLLTFWFLAAIPDRFWTPRGLLRLAWTLGSYGRTDGVLRLPRPGASWGLAFAALWSVQRALRLPRPRALALAGVGAGLLAYVRLVEWTTVLGGCFFLGVLESWRTRRLRHALWLPFLAGLGVSLPWLALNVPADPELMDHVGFWTRRPDWTSPVYLVLAALALRRAGDGPPGVLHWLAALMGSVFALCNIQVLTGHRLSGTHWQIFGNTLGALLVVLLVGETWKRKRRLWLGLAAAAAVCAGVQSLAYAYLHYDDHALPAGLDRAARWLRDEAGPDCVVAMLDPEALYAVPALTQCKSLAASAALTWSDIPMVENIRRVRAALRLFGLAPEEFFARDSLRILPPVAEEWATHTHYFTLYYPVDALRERLFDAAPAPEDEFRADYLWAGPFERRRMKAAPDPERWRLVIDADGNALYRRAGGRNP